MRGPKESTMATTCQHFAQSITVADYLRLLAGHWTQLGQGGGEEGGEEEGRAQQVEDFQREVLIQYVL